MPVYGGINKFKKISVGETEIKEGYVGTNQVFSNGIEAVLNLTTNINRGQTTGNIIVFFWTENGSNYSSIGELGEIISDNPSVVTIVSQSIANNSFLNIKIKGEGIGTANISFKGYKDVNGKKIIVTNSWKITVSQLTAVASITPTNGTTGVLTSYFIDLSIGNVVGTVGTITTSSPNLVVNDIKLYSGRIGVNMIGSTVGIYQLTLNNFRKTDGSFINVTNSLSLSITAPIPPSNDNLNQYLKFNGTLAATVGTAATNSSLNGLSYTTGIKGQGAQITISSTGNRYLKVSPQGSTNFTISLWIKPLGSSYSIFSSGQYQSFLSSSASGITFIGYDYAYSSSGKSVSSATPLILGQWNHVVITQSSTASGITINGTQTLKIFVNGVLRGTQTYNGYPAYMTSNMNLNNASGVYDELAYWQRALSDSESMALYNGGQGLELIV